MGLGIPEDQIKIKTADINELKGIDLMNRECTVLYIITVNALKEGWDCPFAYILASLADKSSAVDVEQVLGRILRMPHVQQHAHDLLNLSYVFTASSLFMDTLQSVVKALNRAGFSDKDFRDITPQHDQQDQPTDHIQPKTNDLFGMFQDQSNQANNFSSEESGSSNLDDLDVIGKEYLVATQVGTDGVREESGSQVFVDQVTQQAIVQNKNYEKQAEEAVNADIPADL